MGEQYFYSRKLPHWQPAEETFFITYRLADSLPLQVIARLKENYQQRKILPDNQTQERKEIIRQDYFFAFEDEIEKNLNKPHWLKKDEIASVVIESLFFNNNKHYELWAACIMSNHVHILISLLQNSPLLNVILQNHKKFTAVQGNRLLGRAGKFWAEESFDTIIRNNSHFFNVIHYIINNPVKAGLAKKWNDWKWTYLHSDMREEFMMSPKDSN